MEGYLGKYEIRRTLGRGAAGTVYEAWDPVIERQVAIKTVKLPDAHDTDAQEEITRFRREAQAAGRLTHPNIVGVFDYGETDDIAYIVMEYVDGESLKAVLDRKERFPIPEIIRVMDELLAGLGFSHERGVVHRDIKPANLMLTKQGRLKIADFGIARIESSGLTQVGTIMGTPAYMSPEQFTGQVVDPRTDLYSAGVVLYQLLTGERPFEGSMSSIMQKALNTTPPKPSEIAVTAPVAFDVVVQRAMAKRPDQRFPSAAAFATALHAAAAPAAAGDAAADSDATIVQTNIAGVSGAAVPAQPVAAPVAPPVVEAPPVAPPVALPVPPPAAMISAPAASRSSLPLVGGIAAGVLLVGGGLAWFLVGSSPQPPAVSPANMVSEPPSAPTKPAPVKPAPTTPAPITPPAVTSPAPSPPPSPVPAPQASQPPMPAIQPAPATSPVVPPSAVPVPAVPPSIVPPSVAPAPVVSAPVVSAPVVSAPVVSAPAVPAPAAPAPAAPPEAEKPAARLDRTALAAGLAAIPCAMLDGNVSDSGVRLDLTGVIADGAPRAALASVLAQAAPGVYAENQVQPFPRSADYCRALDVLRPALPRFGDVGARLELRTADGKTRLTTDAPIKLRVRMPDFAGELRVEYMSSDGNVYHVHPADGAPTRVYQPGQDVKPGAAGGDGKVGEVGEPYGSDMIFAIASSSPLFSKPRPKAAEPAGPFLKELQAAIEALRKRGASVEANVMILDTAAR